MRIFTALYGTETNTFAPFPTSADQFEPAVTPGSPPRYHPFAMIQRVLNERAATDKLEIVEGRGGFATPAGTTTRRAHETLRDQLLADLDRAMPVDAVILSMHGAMVADGYDDAEGDVLKRVRARVGKDVVIGVEMDLHGILTKDKIENTDILVFFKEYPHIDIYERAQEVVDLSLAAVRKQIKPTKSVVDCNTLAVFRTTEEPTKSFVERMRREEKAEGVLSISFIHSFPWADTADIGAKMLVITDNDQPNADKIAHTLASEVLKMREGCRTNALTPEAAIDQALASSAFPVVCADTADNTGGGAAGDSTFFLEAMLAKKVTSACFGPFYDPGALAVCFAAGEGARLPLRIGGKLSAASGKPVDVMVTVRACKDAVDMTNVFGSGQSVGLGRVAVVDTGGIEIVLIEKRQQALGDIFTNSGIDWTKRHLVVVKSSQHFYNAYAPQAAKVLYADSPGSMTLNWASLPYSKRPTPLWPLD